MRTVEIIKRALTLTSEEKDILFQASKVLLEIAIEDDDRRLWRYVNNERAGCDDFYDLSFLLSFLSDDKNELII